MKKILIIGGGIAGLTAGIYAQKAGFQSVIVEKHSITGGECTGWDRKGFHVDGDLTGYPQDFAFQTEKLQVEDEQTDMISYKHYCYEPAFAPVGKSIMIVYFPAKYQWWKEKKREQYMAEKTKLGEDVIKGVEGRFPELQGKIRVLDVATPLTYERYCGAYKGSWMSFGATPKAKQMIHKGRIKGIKNLYMAGQWLMPPGGLPSALLTGKWAIQRIK